MNPSLRLLAGTLALGAALPALAGGNHGHAPLHGGIVKESKAGDFELVAKPERIVIHVRDHGKAGNTTGASGKDKREAVLAPAGSDRLEAAGPFVLGPGTKIVATVQLAGKPPVSLRFTLP